MKLIIGLVGPLCAGKGTTAKYLQEKYGADVHRFSTMLRDILNRLFLPITRETMVNLSELVRGQFGDDLMSKVISREVSADPAEIAVVDGIRRPLDQSKLLELPNFHLVAIDADSQTRYERMVKRGENEDDRGKTFEQFTNDHQKPTEVLIADLAKSAEATLDNNGTIENLYRQIDELLKRWQI
ncbi:MAG: hypothetical protein HW383_641 [Candidatus Magasanikbacteria bacterium]|nr:hypothetical protein [Candidatus Magasanikbacteria bacterium]